jgi:hypothetical protein
VVHYGRPVRIALAVLVGLVAAVLLRPDGNASPAPMASVYPTADPHWVDVHLADDVGKPGASRSVMGQLTVRQAPYTSGPSADSLRFRFDAPVEVTGILVSIDISGPHLVELVAGINLDAPYGVEEAATGRSQTFVGRDWLIHTSDSNGGRPSKIDEHITLPTPVELAAGDWIAADTWLGNLTGIEQSVSPEVIVFYRWL